MVSSFRPLAHLHMGLCGPMRNPSQGGKKHIFVIMYDYSRYTWTLFLRSNYETLQVFIVFAKQFQVMMVSKIVSICSDYRTEFKNANFNDFCVKNSISYSFLDPQTP